MQSFRLGAGIRLKGALEEMQLAHSYQDIRWNWAARRRSPLTKWNYRHSAIFVHIPRTAGLSVYSAFDMERPYDTHAPIAAYRAADPALFQRAFKFAVVRNPWDRLVSGFHHLKAGPSEGKRWDEDDWWSRHYLTGVSTFQEFLRSLRNPSFRRNVRSWRHFVPQYRFLTAAHSELHVDELVRFEHLETGLDQAASKIGVTTSLKKLNGSNRLNYKVFYSSDDIEFVGRLYARDIELFSYTFDGSPP